ncbi:MAG: hypothetical protein M1817_002708 [Caeruleum heppii]|nr:MAG: hypothetical protein M1817_002708 [Caeruleum heppii]
MPKFTTSTRPLSTTQTAIRPAPRRDRSSTDTDPRPQSTSDHPASPSLPASPLSETFHHPYHRPSNPSIRTPSLPELDPESKPRSVPRVEPPAWLQYEPPSELLNVPSDTGSEVRSIITESVVEVRAPFVVDPPPVPAKSPGRRRDDEGLLSVAEEGVRPTSSHEIAVNGHHTEDHPNHASTGAAKRRSHDRNVSLISTATAASTNDDSAAGMSVTSTSSRTSLNSSVATSTTSRSRPLPKAYAAGPVGLIPNLWEAPREGAWSGERYVPPKLESPYAKRIKKLFSDKKSVGECASCFDDMKNKKLVALECLHKYCLPCFNQLVMKAIMDQEVSVSKCCDKDISPVTIKEYLYPDKRAVYKLKAKEHSIPTTDRWYCPRAVCAEWLDVGKPPPNSSIKCSYCRSRICTTCRGLAHENGVPCSKDVEKTTATQGMVRDDGTVCYQCRSVISLTTGSHRIRCSCKAEFCHVCASPWHTCACTEQQHKKRQEEIQGRRFGDDHEAREVAAAIAAVESSQQEEIRMAKQREDRQRAEDERMRSAEADLSKARDADRVSSIRQRFQILREELDRVHLVQRQAMNERHQYEREVLAENQSKSAEAYTDAWNAAGTRFERHISTEADELRARQAQDLADLTVRHEEEEDDAFLDIRAHLRGKPNAETREKAAMDKVRKRQQTERESLVSAHAADRDRLEHGTGETLDSVRDRLAARRNIEIDDERTTVVVMQRRTGAEAEWSRALVERRRKMLARDEEGLVVSGASIEGYSRRSFIEGAPTVGPMTLGRSASALRSGEAGFRGSEPVSPTSRRGSAGVFEGMVTSRRSLGPVEMSAVVPLELSV